MMAAPTREDAQLMMQILQYGAALGMQVAVQRVMGDDFDPETADAADSHVGTILNISETVGTFVKLDLLSAELVHELFWVQGMWARVGPAALRSREKHGEPRLYENFEALAAG
jgi:hypothetical protein